ncbi:hypothetical protein F5Y10DRAFT_267864 [Nemania abortiva]|nr:hypothetical protein F5Y10DRAFT_267864 [Nemania abortiva]
MAHVRFADDASKPSASEGRQTQRIVNPFLQKPVTRAPPAGENIRYSNTAPFSKNTVRGTPSGTYYWRDGDAKPMPKPKIVPVHSDDDSVMTDVETRTAKKFSSLTDFIKADVKVDATTQTTPSLAKRRRVDAETMTDAETLTDAATMTNATTAGSCKTRQKLNDSAAAVAATTGQCKKRQKLNDSTPAAVTNQCSKTNPAPPVPPYEFPKTNTAPAVVADESSKKKKPAVAVGISLPGGCLIRLDMIGLPVSAAIEHTCPEVCCCGNRKHEMLIKYLCVWVGKYAARSNINDKQAKAMACKFIKTWDLQVPAWLKPIVQGWVQELQSDPTYGRKKRTPKSS